MRKLGRSPRKGKTLSLLKAICIIMSGVLGLVVSAGDSYARENDVDVVVKRGIKTWSVQYVFHKEAEHWSFPRTSRAISGDDWRQASYHVMTKGVVLEKAGGLDTFSRRDLHPLRRVKLEIEPYTSPLVLDYKPALRFSDGSVAIYTGQFFVVPRRTRDASEALTTRRPELASSQSEDINFIVRDSHLLYAGDVTEERASAKLNNTGSYIYIGDTPIEKVSGLSFVVDRGMPTWINEKLHSFLPALSKLYGDNLGLHLPMQPVALFAWEGSAHAGYSQSGGTLPGLIVVGLSGKSLLTENTQMQASLDWFLAHEYSHFWIGQAVRYSAREEGWITEGEADFLSIQANRLLNKSFDINKKLKSQFDDCLNQNGDQQALRLAEQAGRYRAQYTCGSLLALAAEWSLRRSDRLASPFAFSKALLQRNAKTGLVSQASWIELFSEGAGKEVGLRVHDFIESGVPDSIKFWKDLFADTGVPVVWRGNEIEFSIPREPAGFDGSDSLPVS